MKALDLLATEENIYTTFIDDAMVEMQMCFHLYHF